MHLIRIAAATRRLALFLLLCGLWSHATAQEVICAVVKIEIRQELTLERQAFQAKMIITNGLDTMSLDDVDIDVLFSDEVGNPVLASSDPSNTNAKFFIRLDEVSGVENVTGSGRIAPNAVAEVTWLIIPAPGAGGATPTGKLYNVGATLSYTFGGEEQVVTVAPDIIRVRPMPMLTLDYFLPRDVFGDDPLTETEEPIEAFDLGVRVLNSGAGPAQALKIESAQPKIVENRQGLLINFELLGSSVDDAPVQNTLLANFGDIAPDRAKMARWVMTSSLSGRFVSFDAEFVHKDELGGALTSLIEQVRTHNLLRTVRNDLPGRDAVRDFLAVDGSVLRLYESDGADTPVTDLSASATLQPLSPLEGRPRYKLTVSASQGPIFVRVTDPHGTLEGGYDVWRSDGKRIDTANAWRYRAVGESGAVTRSIGVFDTSTTGQYELRFGTAVAENHAPVIAPVAAQTVQVGQALEVAIAATDPDGDTVSLLASGLPPGATFDDLGGGVGRLRWTPIEAQVGEHAPVIAASDGTLTAQHSVAITVTAAPTSDSDHDGMEDDWEREHFGDLSHDGNGDTDQDSASDKAEHDHHGDPNAVDRPGRATLLAPANADVAEAPIDFVLANAPHAADAAVEYRYELQSWRVPLATPSVAQVGEQPLETTWASSDELDEDQLYVWRAGASDGATVGDWSYGAFRFSRQNDAPTTCTLAWPAIDQAVPETRPVLSVRIGADPEGDLQRYQVEVFADAGLVERVVASPVLERAAAAELAWRVFPALETGRPYWWRASTIDAEGQPLARCPVGSFNVDPSQPSLAGYSLTTSAVDGYAAGAQLATTLSGIPAGAEAEFELSLDSAFEGDAVERASVAATDGRANWSVDGLDHGHTYYLRARARNADRVGAWVSSQATAVSAQVAAFALSPRDGTWVDSRLPQLQVRSPGLEPTAGHFRFQLANDETFAAPLADAIGGPRFSPSTALVDRRWYWWRVRAEHGADVGAWSSAMRFFVIDNGVEDAPQLRWTAPTADLTIRPGLVELQWQAHDADSNASISLWLDGDDGADVLIQDGLHEDIDHRFVWDMAGLPDGEYRVFARISDDTHTTTVHADGVITLATPRLLVESQDTQTSEAGDTAELTLRLGAAPRDQVIVPISVDAADEASVMPDVIVFNPDDWQTVRRVVVRGLDDDRVDVDHAFQLRWGGTVSEDAAYAGLSGRVDMVNVDNDVAGILLSAPDGALATSEQGDASLLTLSLATRPASDVTLQLAVNDASEAVVTPAEVTFTGANWNVPVDLTVTGLDDADVDGDVAFRVEVVSIESEDAVYRDAARPFVSGLNLDDERPEILVTPTEGVVVSETGTTIQLRVRTNVRPDAPILVAVTSSDSTEARVSVPELVLDAGNWEEGLHVDVTGVGDQQLDGDQPFTITLGPAQSEDPRFAQYRAIEVPGVNQDRRDTGFQAGRDFIGTWTPGEVKRVALSDVFSAPPIVFAQWISNDARPYAVRLVDVGADHFDAVLVRPAGMESHASNGELVFLAAQVGVHHLPDGRRFVVDAFEQLPQTGAPVWQAREFALPFASTPVVLTQIQTFANRQDLRPNPWLGLAVSNVAGNGLQLALETAGVIDAAAPQVERLGYFAIANAAQGVIGTTGTDVEYEARRDALSLRSAAGACSPSALSHSRATSPLLWLSQNSRSVDAGSWARACRSGTSYAELRLDRYDDLTGGDTAESEAVGLLALSGPLALRLQDAPVGALIEQRFGNRTFVDAPGAAFGLRLSHPPTHDVTLPLSVSQAQRLVLSQASVTFTPQDWAETRWIRATAIGAPASGLEPVRVTLGSPQSGDGRFALLPSSELSIEVGAAATAHHIVDNGDAAFASVGDWRRVTTVAGFYGSDYATHVAMGSSPDGIVVDNGDVGYRTIGEWTRTTQRAGFYGTSYDVRSPGESPDARFVDDAEATLTGSWKSSRAGGPTYYGSGYHVARAGDGSIRAEWRLGGLPAGDYQVFARWADHPHRASNAPYVVRHAEGTTRLTVNQRSNGGSWQGLGTFRVDADSSVTLSNDANGEVAADAIRVLPINAQPNSAIWEPALPAAGRYEVFARWPAHKHHATDAPFSIRHAASTTVVRVDQETGGGAWVSLGAYDFAAQGARVMLTDEANDDVVADAVRFVPSNARPNRANWTFRATPLGVYRYGARWTAAADRASNAPFLLQALEGNTVASLNQRIDHARWRPFARALSAPERDTLVELTDRADGVVVADAVRALDEASFGPRGSRIVDDEEAEATGTWAWTSSPSGFYDQGFRWIAAGDDSARLDWSAAPATASPHRVFVRWVAAADRSGAARYRVQHAGGESYVELDQRQAPGSGGWTLLGSFDLDVHSSISLLRAVDGSVSGDAVRLEPAHYPEPTP